MTQTVSILIADDDAAIRQCLRHAIEWDANVSIIEAHDGLQALLYAHQYQPNVILLDVHMPRMDGLETTRCLRQNNCRARIVVMSVYDHVRQQAMAAGADAFVTKDSGCDAIREAISHLCPRGAGFGVAPCAKK